MSVDVAADTKLSVGWLVPAGSLGHFSNMWGEELVDPGLKTSSSSLHEMCCRVFVGFDCFYL